MRVKIAKSLMNPVAIPYFLRKNERTQKKINKKKKKSKPSFKKITLKNTEIISHLLFQVGKNSSSL